MLTIDIKLNGEIIAQARLANLSQLAEVSDYQLAWMERAEPSLGITPSTGSAVIKGHRRRQTVWALASRAVLAILGQMIDHGEANDVRPR